MNNTNTATGLWLKTAENMFDEWSSISEPTPSTLAIVRELNALSKRDAALSEERDLTFSQALRLTHQLDDDVKTLEKQFGTGL